MVLIASRNNSRAMASRQFQFMVERVNLNALGLLRSSPNTALTHSSPPMLLLAAYMLMT
jgi:hypothetical protein